MQDSAAADCASPAVCIKDSLYPLRKELLNKPTPSRSTKPGARKTPKNGRTPSSTPITRARSKETVINSPWLITDGAADDKKANNNCANTDELKKKYCGETGEMKETEGGASAVQSCIKTRGQKRKFPLKENLEVDVSLFVVSTFCGPYGPTFTKATVFDGKIWQLVSLFQCPKFNLLVF